MQKVRVLRLPITDQSVLRGRKKYHISKYSGTSGGADALGGLRCPQSSFATITLVIVTLRCHDVVFITAVVTS